MKYCARVGDI